MSYLKTFLSGIFLILILGINNLCAQEADPKFKIIAFYNADWDGGHISFAHEANSWFPEMAKKYNFQYDSTNNWTNLNATFLSQYSVVLFLDNAPTDANQRKAFENYMKNGGSWLGFHVVAFNQNPLVWDWYYNQFLGMGSYKNNTWAPTPAVLKVEIKDHPATKNLPDTFRTAPNEWYSWMVDLKTKANIKILCSIDSSSFPLGTGTGSGGASEIWHSGYYPVAWTNTDYHMMYVNWGHNLVDYNKNNKTLSWTFKNETQSKMILDAIFWLADLNKPDPRATKMTVVSPKNGETFKEPATFDIIVNAKDSDGIAKVEFYNGLTKLGEDKESPYSFTCENILMGLYEITIKCTDSLNNIVTSTISVNVQGEGPFNKVKAVIPGKVEIENFDYGGEGIAYSESESANQGGKYRPMEAVDIEDCTDAGKGYNVGYIAAGEWLKYSVNVTSGGYFTLQARVATSNSGKYFHVEMDGVNISGKISVPRTGGWQVWKTVNVPIQNIDQGEKELKIVFDTDGFNFNYINFTHDTVTAIKNSTNEEFSIFPNPSDGVLNIHLKKQNQSSIFAIIDPQGKTIKTYTYQSTKTNIQLDISDLKVGYYFLKLNNSENSTPFILK